MKERKGSGFSNLRTLNMGMNLDSMRRVREAGGEGNSYDHKFSKSGKVFQAPNLPEKLTAI